MCGVYACITPLYLHAGAGLAVLEVDVGLRGASEREAAPPREAHLQRALTVHQREHLLEPFSNVIYMQLIQIYICIYIYVYIYIYIYIYTIHMYI